VMPSATATVLRAFMVDVLLGSRWVVGLGRRVEWLAVGGLGACAGQAVAFGAGVGIRRVGPWVTS
jgi:hypothetical protein